MEDRFVIRDSTIMFWKINGRVREKSGVMVDRRWSVNLLHHVQSHVGGGQMGGGPHLGEGGGVNCGGDCSGGNGVGYCGDSDFSGAGVTKSHFCCNNQRCPLAIVYSDF